MLRVCFLSRFFGSLIRMFLVCSRWIWRRIFRWCFFFVCLCSIFRVWMVLLFLMVCLCWLLRMSVSEFWMIFRYVLMVVCNFLSRILKVSVLVIRLLRRVRLFGCWKWIVFGGLVWRMSLRCCVGGWRWCVICVFSSLMRLFRLLFGWGLLSWWFWVYWERLGRMVCVVFFVLRWIISRYFCILWVLMFWLLSVIFCLNVRVMILLSFVWWRFSRSWSSWRIIVKCNICRFERVRSVFLKILISCVESRCVLRFWRWVSWRLNWCGLIRRFWFFWNWLSCVRFWWWFWVFWVGWCLVCWWFWFG